MELTEATIEEALRECLVFVRGDKPGVVTLSYRECTHAIFERLQEGVVWEKVGPVSVYESEFNPTDTLCVGDNESYANITDSKDKSFPGLRGEILAVTVRRKP